MIRQILVGLLLLTAVLASVDIFAKQLYRWQDEDGNVYFSDIVPPEHAGQRRETLSPSGRVIKIKEKTKSKEEQALDRRFEKSREAQLKIIEKQKSYDKVLLSNFRSLDDLLLTVRGKEDIMHRQIEAAEGNLSLLKLQLDGQLAKAADFERNGNKVPEKLKQAISATREQIKVAEITLSNRQEQKRQLQQDHERDIERYLFLTQKDNPDDRFRDDIVPEITATKELGLYFCKNDYQCGKAWQVARKFVYYHSTTGADIDNETLIMTQMPATDKDLSVSISRLRLNEVEYQIFLDFRCRNSSRGRELCSGEKVRQIRESFQQYINLALARSANQ